MSVSPYRSGAERADDEDATEPAIDMDVLPFLALLWIASAVRFVSVLVQREAYSTEPTLAFLAVVLLPVVTKDALRDLASRCCPRRRPRRR